MFMRKILFVMVACGLMGGIANAQNNATLTGTVADESNAVHPGYHHYRDRERHWATVHCDQR